MSNSDVNIEVSENDNITISSEESPDIEVTIMVLENGDTNVTMEESSDIVVTVDDYVSYWGELLGNPSDSSKLVNYVNTVTTNKIGNGTLIFKQHSQELGRFTANQSTNTEINLAEGAVEWGEITGDIVAQADLQNKFNTKQDNLTAGANIGISNNVISFTGTIPTVNNNTVTIKQGDVTKGTFTLNQDSDITITLDEGDSAEWGNITGTLSNQTDLQTALNGKQPTGDYATNTALTQGLATKQNTLTAGNNIQINNNTISATDTTYTAGTGISIENNVISNTQTSAEWGNITGTITNQTDLINLIENSKSKIIYW